MTTTEQAQHQSFMQICIQLAQTAKARGESPVGSLIVQNGTIIGKGIECGKAHNDITFHAEIEAIRAATKYLGNGDLSGCILYTTHEPCIMCSYVIRHTRISVVVAGLTTGEIGGISSSMPLLLNAAIARWSAPPTVITGIFEKECADLHKS